MDADLTGTEIEDDLRPLVSVIIPAYNAVAYLAEAVESALAQTYENLEIIIVNDGSTDDTGQLARTFGPRVRTYDQENRGIAGARNTGIRHARGSIIALLDADDLWFPERIEKCVALLESDPNLGFVTTDAFLMIDDRPTEQRYYGAYQRYPFPERSEQLHEIARRNFMFVSVVFDRRLLTVTGRTFDETMRAAEDFELWTRFLLAGTYAGLVPEPLALYRIRPDSISRIRDKQWMAHRSVLERYLRLLWLHGAAGRPRDEFEIGIELISTRHANLGLRWVAHAITNREATMSQRVRFVVSAASAILSPRRPEPTAA